ncbi:MAG: hypothetical protein H6842_03160 [Rhodospirillaceae bacterium]|nr:hypothetical protein [Rhodospirillaceae bacterium]
MPRYLVMAAVIAVLSSGPAMAQTAGQYRSALHEQYARAIELCNSLGWVSFQCQQNRTNVQEFCARGTPGWCELAALIRDDAERSPFPHQRLTVEPQATLPTAPSGAVGSYVGTVQPLADPPFSTGTVSVPPVTPTQPLPLQGTAAPGSGVVAPPAGNDGRTFNDVLQGLTSQ